MSQIKIKSKNDFIGLPIEEIKAHLKVSSNDDNNNQLILSQLNSAVEYVENYCNIFLREVELDVYFEDYEIDSDSVIMPIAPLFKVNNVWLVDSNGTKTESTFSIKGLDPAEIKLVYAFGYNVKINCICGYGIDADNDNEATEPIPAIALQCIKEILANWDENRGDSTNLINRETRNKLNSISYKSWI